MLKTYIFGKKTEIFFLLGIIIFVTLLFKNPFSSGTTIPNFEPFPDSMEYVVPARSLVLGKGMVLWREGRSLSSNVAPLYSLTLAPIYLINHDPRMFYIINAILALLGAVFFFLVLNKLVTNVWLKGFIFFLYITNFYVYWYPSLAMADNLVMTLFIIGLFLMTKKVTPKIAFFYGLSAISFLLAKYSALPLCGAMTIIFLFRILKTSDKRKLNLEFFLGTELAVFLIFVLYENFSGDLNVINTLGYFLSAFTKVSKSGVIPSGSASPNEGFGLGHFWGNLTQYLGYLIGRPVTFLWSSVPIVPAFAGVLGLAGLLLGLWGERRGLLAGLILILVFSVAFMSTFSPVDARYIYYLIPLSLLGMGIFILEMEQLLKLGNFKYLVESVVGILLIFYLLVSVKTIYHQIGGNIKGSGTPWYFVSIQMLNNYFSEEKSGGGKEPIVITSLPPYLVDFYSNGNYRLLPLSLNQDFRKSMNEIWGPNDYSNLPELYRKYLDMGYPLYVGGFGIVNQDVFNKDFKVIQKDFKVTKEMDGCLSLCNIYKVEKE